jgi:hypothetical protein
MRAAVAALALPLALAACQPPFSPEPSLLDRNRLLAVAADPPEVARGERTTLRALAGSPAGAVEGARARFALCLAPKALVDANSVAAACLEDGPDVAQLGEGAAITLAAPGDACRRVGPDPPPVAGGEDPLRPRDPDETGGYALPVRVTLSDDPMVVGFALVRLRCNLASAPAEIARAFAAGYVPNRAPALASVSARDGAGAPLDWGRLPRAAEITVEAAFADGAAERYLAYDPEANALVEAREALRLSWFGTAGRFATARTGRAPDEPPLPTANRLTLPDAPGPLTIVAVLRDGRGGVTWRVIDAAVE